MDKWLYELCNNKKTVVPKFELMEFIVLCNKHNIIPFVNDEESYDKFDKNNPYEGITEGVVLEFKDELDIYHGYIIASYRNKGEKYKKLIKKGYDVFSALRVLRI